MVTNTLIQCLSELLSTKAERGACITVDLHLYHMYICMRDRQWLRSSLHQAEQHINYVLAMRNMCLIS